MSEQKLNSIPNAEVNSVSHACHKPMLAAGNSVISVVLNSLISLICPPYTKWRILEVFYYANQTYCLSAKQNTFTGLVKFKVVKVCKKEVEKSNIIKHFSESS